MKVPSKTSLTCLGLPVEALLLVAGTSIPEADDIFIKIKKKREKEMWKKRGKIVFFISLNARGLNGK